MSRWGVLVAGIALLLVGGSLIGLAVLLPESLLVLMVAGLFGTILSVVGLVALVAGTWLALRTDATGSRS